MKAAATKTRTSGLRRILKKNYQFYLLVLPAVIFTFIFCYIPMYGAQIGFRDFQFGLGYLGSPWVGFKHFIRFFNEPDFWRLIKNTIITAEITFFDFLL